MGAAADTDLHAERGPREVYSLLLEEGGRPELGAAIKAGDVNSVRDLVARKLGLLAERFTVDFWDQHGAMAPVAIAPATATRAS